MRQLTSGTEALRLWRVYGTTEAVRFPVLVLVPLVVVFQSGAGIKSDGQECPSYKPSATPPKIKS
jgi:hypothetical protein